jgi:hypothetical protein
MIFVPEKLKIIRQQMELISREQAKLQNLKRYFTGNPCSKGHTAERYVGNRHCSVCQLEKAKNWIKLNPEKKSLHTKMYYQRNPEVKAAANNRYYKSNKDKVKKTQSLYKKNNRGKYRFYSASRRALEAMATPCWSDLDQIKEIYLNCPEGHQVDHIIPLKGKLVCGLHVPENLQYLTKEDNLKKSNKHLTILS